MEQAKIKKLLFFLIALSTVIRILLAAITELGNDEVYYWTYALFPSLSYFDHPPMVGILIWVTTLGTFIHGELFVRLGAIIAGSLNLWLIFRIGEYIKDSRTGFYASLLYAASLYGSIIAGTFILPDSPQTVFWLLTLFLFMKSILKNPDESGARANLLLAGITAGLAMLCKYHSAFLLLGAACYVIFYNRSWFKTKELYISLLMTIILFLPVMIWNYSTDFISFRFHSSRIGFFSNGININTFLQEFLGQVFYSNPVNFILILAALIALFKNKFEFQKEFKRFLLLTGLPIILIFLSIALSARTFPHWSAPGYFSLIIIAAVWLKSKNIDKYFPISVRFSVIFLAVIVVLGLLALNVIVLITQPQKTNITELGDKDVTLEMYGWKQIGEEFKKIHENYVSSGTMPVNAPVISNKWYIAAHADYYAAHPLGLETFALGPVIDIRNYFFVNRKRNSINRSLKGYYITTSHDYKDPKEVIQAAGYETSGEPDTIMVYRNGMIIEYAFVYRLNLFR